MNTSCLRRIKVVSRLMLPSEQKEFCRDYSNYGVCKFGKGCSIGHPNILIEKSSANVSKLPETVIASEHICPHYYEDICDYHTMESIRRNRHNSCYFIHLKRLTMSVDVPVTYKESSRSNICTRDGIKFYIRYAREDGDKTLVELPTYGKSHLIPARKRFARYCMYLEMYMFLCQTLGGDIAKVLTYTILSTMGIISARSYTDHWRYRIL